jgi:hypothetical protein
MKKRILDEYLTKAKKREQKKRPRMRVHSRSLILQTKHAGKKLTTKKH